jgi:hypothetical protein
MINKNYIMGILNVPPVSFRQPGALILCPSLRDNDTAPGDPE